MIPAKLYGYVIGLAITAVLLLGGGWWAHHKGVEAQKAADAVKLEQVTQERDYAQSQIAEAATALKKVNDYAELQKKAAQAQRDMADAAVADIAKERNRATQETAVWRAKFEKAAASKDCAAIMVQPVCPEVFKP